MPSIPELQAELNLLRINWRNIPATTPQEVFRRECMENIILLQKDCEKFRESFRREYVTTKTKKVLTEVNGENFVTIRTEFNFEPIRDTFFKMLHEKETKGIAYYQSKILESYADEQQSSSADSNSIPDQQAAA